MQIILKHILRNISEKKGRSILIIVSLVIASCVFILNLTIPNQIIEENKNKTRTLIGSTDILIGNYDEFNIEDIDIGEYKLNYVGVNQNGIIHKEKTFMIYGTNINESYKQQLISTDNLNDDEIIINEATASKYNYKVNDIMSLNIEGNTYELKIKDIVAAKGLLYFKTYSGVINDNTYNKIFNSTGYRTYYIDVIDDESIDSVHAYIAENNSKLAVEKLVDEEKIKENNNYITLILAIIFVMASIMIFFVVSTLNKMIVIERQSVIATFRSIGATKKKMNLILILENAVYGLIGGILGSILALIINNYSISLLLGGEKINASVPIPNIIYGILFAILLEILMSIGAIIKSSKYSIKELMFDNPSSKYQLSKTTTIISIVMIITSILLYLFAPDTNLIIDLAEITMFWIGIANCLPFILLLASKLFCSLAKKINNGSLVLASKNLGTNKMIISSSRLVVIILSIMIVIFDISNAFDKMLDSFSIQFSGYDIFIRDLSKKKEVYDNLVDIPEIVESKSVFFNTGEMVLSNGSKETTEALILGMKESRPDIEEYNYKIKDLKQNEALVDSQYAKNHKIEIGDTITINQEFSKTSHEFKVVGTVNGFYFSVQRDIVIINEDYFIANISDIPYQVTIKVKDNTDLKYVISKIEKELKDPDITIMTVDEFVEDQRENIHTIMFLFYIIIGLALALSIVGIINNQIISFMERTKELAVLNSICMSKKELNNMLILENVLSNITASVIGFIVSVISVKLMNSVLNGIQMYIGLKYNFVIGLIFIGLILLILLLTVIIPIKKFKSINVVEAIKYE